MTNPQGFETWFNCLSSAFFCLACRNKHQLLRHKSDHKKCPRKGMHFSSLKNEIKNLKTPPCKKNVELRACLPSVCPFVKGGSFFLVALGLIPSISTWRLCVEGAGWWWFCFNALEWDHLCKRPPCGCLIPKAPHCNN